MKLKIKSLIPAITAGFMMVGMLGVRSFATETKYNIQLLYNDGVTEDEIVNASNANELPTPTREGYIFGEWYLAEEKVNIDTKSINSFTNPNNAYSWVADPDGVWSSGNKGVHSSTSNMISEPFTTTGGTLSFEWKSYGESYCDYLGYDILNVETGKYLSGKTSPTYSSCLENLKGKSSSSFTTVEYELESGTYQLLFMYGKDSSSNYYDDKGYVKNITCENIKTIYYEATDMVAQGFLTENLILMAKWTPITYTIRYDGNGADSGSVDSIVCTYDELYQLNKNAYTKTGDYVFIEWNTEPDGSGDVYSDEELIKNLTSTNNEEITLYAQWAEVKDPVVFAVYGTVDNEHYLKFYNRKTLIPSVGDKFDRMIVQEIYTEINNIEYTYSSQLPWYSSRELFTKVEIVDEGITPTKTSYWFSGFKNCSEFKLNKLNTSNVTDMRYMFTNAGYNSYSFKVYLSEWDTSNVTTMEYMFQYAGKNAKIWEIEDLSSWNVENVKNMYSMFYEAAMKAQEVDIDLSGWNMQNVTSVGWMFRYFGQDSDILKINLSGWNIPSLTNMNRIFEALGGGKSVFELDITGWNIPNVTNTSEMFYLSGKNANRWYVKGLSDLNLSKVTDTSKMFYAAGSGSNIFEVDISNWDTSNVLNMSQMFASVATTATSWTINGLSELNVQNVTNMSNMFEKAGYSVNEFELDLSNWNTSSVTNTNGMFLEAGYNSTTFEIKGIEDLNVSKVTDMGSMFSKTGYNIEEFKLNLSSWDTSKVTTISSMFSYAGYNSQKFEVNLSEWNTELITTMYSVFYNAGYNSGVFKVDLTNWNTSNVTSMSSMFNYAGNKASVFEIEDLSNFNTSQVTYMGSMFSCAGYSSNVFDIDLSEWDVSNVTDMSNMFSGAGCNASTWNVGDLSGWITGKVENMRYMFNGAGKNATTFNLDISGWDVSKVTDMQYMFSGMARKIPEFNLDLSSWNTEKVTNMTYMFYDAFCNSKNITLNLTNLDTGNVTSMDSMLRDVGKYCETLKIEGLQTLDVSSVTYMGYMFNGTGQNASNFQLDLSNWNTSNVTSTSYMFYNCGAKKLDISSFDTGAVTSMGNMFYMPYLEEIKLGEGFSFNGNTESRLCSLPTPSDEYIPDATGKWYNNETWESFEPNAIPNNISATYTALPQKVSYIVKHWWQNPDGDASIKDENNYTLIDSERFTGVSGESVSPSVKNYEDLTSPQIQTAIITGDGSLVINYYYTRVYEKDEFDPKPVRLGYTFAGWYDNLDFSGEKVTDTNVRVSTSTHYIKWMRNAVQYTVRHYIQKPSGDPSVFDENNYTLKEVELLWAPVETYIIPNTANYNGYSIASEIKDVFIAADTLTKVNYYYVKNNENQEPIALEAGLYDENDDLIVSWEDSGIDDTCSNASSIIRNTYDNTKKVVIPNSVKTIASRSFSYCTSLKYIEIPNAVTNIEDHAFLYTSLSSIKISNSILNIKTGTFALCIDLSSIKIPNTITSIEKDAFDNCAALTDVYYGGTEEEWNALLPNIGSNNDYLLNATIHFNSKF